MADLHATAIVQVQHLAHVSPNSETEMTSEISATPRLKKRYETDELMCVCLS